MSEGCAIVAVLAFFVALFFLWVAAGWAWQGP
jgi:hypothetical protein